MGDDVECFIAHFDLLYASVLLSALFVRRAHEDRVGCRVWPDAVSVRLHGAEACCLNNEVGEQSLTDQADIQTSSGSEHDLEVFLR